MAFCVILMASVMSIFQGLPHTGKIFSPVGCLSSLLLNIKEKQKIAHSAEGNLFLITYRGQGKKFQNKPFWGRWGKKQSKPK